MGTLIKKRILLVLPLFLLVLACSKTLVKQGNFFEEPSAKRKGEFIEINFGTTTALDNWIKPVIKIEDENIYITGAYTFEGLPMTISIKIPETNKRYRVFWIDKNGNKTEITVHQ